MGKGQPETTQDLLPGLPKEGRQILVFPIEVPYSKKIQQVLFARI